MCEEINKLNPDELEDVVGGNTVQIDNPASPYSNLRKAPGLNSEVVLKLRNGEYLETTGRTAKKDGYVWYEVYVINSEDCGGWIAGSLIGY